MQKHNNRLPFLSSNTFAIVMLACTLAGCGRQGDRPMPPPGKPPRPQASLQSPADAIQNAVFPVPSSSVRYGNGQILITEHHVIHT
jgi:predicted small lipoprotein YifL